MLALVCPAAAALQRPTDHTSSVLCGELKIANEDEHIDGFTDRGHVSPVISGDRDRSSVGAYCAGPGVPGALNSYCACPIWRAAKEALWAQRKGAGALRDEQAERPPAGVRDELLA